MTRLKCLFVGTAVGVFALASPDLVGAQRVERRAARPLQSIEGKDTFRAFCASCHGPNAKGDGPAAKALAKTPADLTTITKRHGVFSQSDVENVILGTHELTAHGSRDMPIWGPVFQSISGGDPAPAKLRLANLVTYLKSIQTQ